MIDRSDVEAIFLEYLPWIEEVAAMVCRRNSVWGDDADDFIASARARVMENDYAVLRKFRGDVEMKTYLARVVTLHFMERARERTGRWRPSAAAEAHGQVAKDLETLVYRDGCTLSEAGERLRAMGRTTLTDPELGRVLRKLPMRRPLRPKDAGAEPLDQFPGPQHADQRLVEDEEAAARARVLAALRDALAPLSPEDRMLVHLHLANGRSVAEAARTLRLEQKSLHRRLPRLKSVLRERMERAGVTAAQVRDTLTYLSVGMVPEVPELVWAGGEASLAGPRPAGKGVGARGKPDVPDVPAEPTPTAEPAQNVMISVSAPTTAAPGSLFVARFAAYVPELQAGTLELLRKLAGEDETYENVRESRWAANTKVTVRLTARGLAVDPPEQTFTWRGSRNLVDFVVDVPREVTFAQTVLRFEVLVEGFDVAPIALPLEIGETGEGERDTTTVHPARTAFASYAREDAERVLDKVAAVRIAARLDVFLDCLSLRPNDRFKPELERAIVSRDLFLLFWSPAAKDSPWVGWEWRTAWAKKRRDHFQVHPLAYADPPPEFADLNVSDVLMDLRELEERRRADRAAAG